MRSILSPTNSAIGKFLAVFLLLLVLSSVVLAQGISAEIADIRDKVIEVACYLLVIIEGIVGFLAVLVFVLAALKWIVSEDAEERAEVKEKLAHILVGVVIVILALELANVIGMAVGIISERQTCSWGDAITDTENIRGIIGGPICIIVRVFQFLFAIIGMIVFMGAGIRWITSEDPEERVKARSIAVNVLVGLLLVLIGLNFLGGLFNFSGLSYASHWDTLLTFNCAGYESLDIGQLDDVAQYTVCMVFLIIDAIAGVIAVVVVAVAGILLIISEDSSLRNKAKSLAFAAVVGMIIVIIGGQFLESLFTPAHARNLSWTCELGTESEIVDLIRYTICTVKNILAAIVSLVAVIALMASAFIWITSGSPEARASAKIASIIALVGLFVAIIGLQYLGSFFGGDVISFTCGAAGEGTDIVDLIANVLCLVYNILRSVVAVVAAIMVLFGGFMYIVSDSDRDRARGKNMIAAAIIGFIIALISIQFITVVISGTGLAVIDCPDEYETCVEDCFEGEPSPVPGGGGTTTTGTVTTTTGTVTTTTGTVTTTTGTVTTTTGTVTTTTGTVTTTTGTVTTTTGTVTTTTGTVTTTSST
ncbi:MAG: hypothetical protein U9M95_07040, partial [Candidatus Altiarchaeota archaeon]|nr:hypothetical protein [Candidatus Altiarchaeota archaeon]